MRPYFYEINFSQNDFTIIREANKIDILAFNLKNEKKNKDENLKEQKEATHGNKVIHLYEHRETKTKHNNGPPQTTEYINFLSERLRGKKATSKNDHVIPVNK